MTELGGPFDHFDSAPRLAGKARQPVTRLYHIWLEFGIGVAPGVEDKAVAPDGLVPIIQPLGDAAPLQYPYHKPWSHAARPRKPLVQHSGGLALPAARVEESGPSQVLVEATADEAERVGQGFEPPERGGRVAPQQGQIGSRRVCHVCELHLRQWFGAHASDRVSPPGETRQRHRVPSGKPPR